MYEIFGYCCWDFGKALNNKFQKGEFIRIGRNIYQVIFHIGSWHLLKKISKKDERKLKMKTKMTIYFVYYYEDIFHYDNGIIIGVSTNKKECDRIIRENKRLAQELGFKDPSYKIISYEPTDKFTYL